MEPKIISKRELVITALVSIFFVIVILFFTLLQKKTKIIFCDVGNGRAIYIHTLSGRNILINTGPDGMILECLSHAMPFYDKAIDILIITTFHKADFGEIKQIISHYAVKKIIVLAEKDAQKTELLQTMHIDFYYRTAPFLVHIGTSSLASIRSDTFLFHDGALSLLFVQEKMSFIPSIHNLIIEIPHSGAYGSISEGLLDKKKPFCAVLSVGKNRYNYPAKATIDILKNSHIDLLRTDERGEIIFLYDSNNIRLSH